MGITSASDIYILEIIRLNSRLTDTFLHKIKHRQTFLRLRHTIDSTVVCRVRCDGIESVGRLHPCGCSEVFWGKPCQELSGALVTLRHFVTCSFGGQSQRCYPARWWSRPSRPCLPTSAEACSRNASPVMFPSYRFAAVDSSTYILRALPVACLAAWTNYTGAICTSEVPTRYCFASAKTSFSGCR